MSVAEEYKQFYKQLLEIQSDFLLKYYINMFQDLSKENMSNLYKIYQVSYNTNKFEYVYFMYNEVTQLIKIGKSKNPKQRIATINTIFKTQFGIDGKIHLIGLICVPSGNSLKLEQLIHKKYECYRQNGEWFNISQKQVYDFLNSNIVNKINDENFIYHFYDDDFIQNIPLKYPTKNELYTFALDTLDEYTIKLSNNEKKLASIMKKYIHTNLCGGNPNYFMGLDTRNIDKPFSNKTNKISWEMFKWIYLNKYIPLSSDDVMLLLDSNMDVLDYIDYIRKLLHKDGYYELVTE